MSFLDENRKTSLKNDLEERLEEKYLYLLDKLYDDLLALPAQHAVKNLLTYLLENDIKYAAIDREKIQFDNY